MFEIFHTSLSHFNIDSASSWKLLLRLQSTWKQDGGRQGEIALYSWFTCRISTTVTLIRFSPMGKLQETELLPSGIGWLPLLYFGNKYSLRNPWGEWLTHADCQTTRQKICRPGPWNFASPGSGERGQQAPPSGTMLNFPHWAPEVLLLTWGFH